MKQKTQIAIVLAAIIVSFSLGVFMERRSTVGRLQNAMQEQIRDLDLRVIAVEDHRFGSPEQLAAEPSPFCNCEACQCKGVCRCGEPVGNLFPNDQFVP